MPSMAPLSASPSPSHHTFLLDFTLSPPRLTIVLRGELDFADCHQLMESLGQLDTDGVQRVTIDLRRLEFIDAAGLRTLREYVDAHREVGCEVRLVRSTAPVRRMFTLVGGAEYLDPPHATTA